METRSRHDCVLSTATAVAMPPLLHPRARDPRVQPPRAGAGAPRRRAAARAAALRLHRLVEPRRVLRGPLRRLPRGVAHARRGDVGRATSRRSPPTAHALIDEQYAVFNDEVMPALAARGHRHPQPRRPQRRRSGAGSTRFFEAQVRPLLVPVGLDPSHPFPQVANKSLNFIARLGGKDAFGRAQQRSPSSRCRACCRA